jgi:hypothetical protein
MPHARIDLHRTHAPRLPEFSQAILQGMVKGFDMPADDFFQKFTLHDEGELFYSPTFPSQQRTDIIFIELTAGVGYTDEQKQATFAAIADGFAELGVKRDNILCVILEVHGAAWYAAESTPA